MGEEVSIGELYWECSCGQRLQVNPKEDVSRQRLCPECGSPMTLAPEQPALSETDETLRVDVHDMAKLAQEGVDVGLSGEWDTTDLAEGEDRPKDD